MSSFLKHERKVSARRDWPNGCGPKRSDTSKFCAPHQYCVSGSIETDEEQTVDSAIPESEKRPSLDGSNEVESRRSKINCTQCLCCGGKSVDGLELSCEDAVIRKLWVNKLLRDESERVEASSKTLCVRRKGRFPSPSDPHGPSFVDPLYPRSASYQDYHRRGVKATIPIDRSHPVTHVGKACLYHMQNGHNTDECLAWREVYQYMMDQEVIPNPDMEISMCEMEEV
ncbi:hypothetical protein M5689_024950 [Euphorbia peplus]|nr:hypothetical protein M5689_024950 [Euphorbia peplus]